MISEQKDIFFDTLCAKDINRNVYWADCIDRASKCCIIKKDDAVPEFMRMAENH